MTILRLYRDRLAAVRARAAAELAPVTKADPADVARAAHAVMDREKRAAEERSREPPPACTAGCAYCCHVNVELTRAELLAVANHLNDALPEPELRSFRDGLHAHVERTSTMSDAERWAARIPCALLDPRGRCSIYPVRPLRCRAFHSTSLAACRNAFHDATSDAAPATNPSVERVLNAVEAGFDDALALAGLESAPLRLEEGLLAELDIRAPCRKFPGAPCSSPSSTSSRSSS